MAMDHLCYFFQMGPVVLGKFSPINVHREVGPAHIQAISFFMDQYNLNNYSGGSPNDNLCKIIFL